MAKMTKAQYEDLRKQLTNTQQELDFVLADKTKMKGRASEVMEKMSDEWKALYKWMGKMHKSAEENYYVEGPHGRRRHLYGMMIPREDIVAALLRRAVNAPVQGFGADVGHTAARLFDIHMHMFLRKFKLMDPDSSHIPGAIECAVHDALFTTPPYRLILPTLQIKHACMTYLVCDWFAEYYDNHWLTPPEVETEIGWHEANMSTWDFTIGTDVPDPKEKTVHLRECVRRGLQEQFDNGLFPKGVTVKDAMSEVFDLPEEWTKYLDARYPWFGSPEHMQ